MWISLFQQECKYHGEGHQHNNREDNGVLALQKHDPYYVIDMILGQDLPARLGKAIERA
jgi:hypothetical protein